MKPADTLLLSPRRRLQGGNNPPLPGVTKSVRRGESPRQSVSLILLERPSHRKVPKITTLAPRRPSRPKSGQIQKKRFESQPRSVNLSIEKEKPRRAEVSLDQAVLELSEIKAEYHLEKTEIERQLQAVSHKAAHKVVASESIGPSTALFREQRLSEKLAAAERTMQALYERNQELEMEVAAQPKPHQECQGTIEALEKEAKELKAQVQALQLQVTAKYEARVKDLTPGFMESLIRDSLKDSKRYLDTYWTLHDLIHQLGPHSSLTPLLQFEQKYREHTRQEFEQRLERLEKLNCDLYVRSHSKAS